jgi:hypothetical protein
LAIRSSAPREFAFTGRIPNEELQVTKSVQHGGDSPVSRLGLNVSVPRVSPLQYGNEITAIRSLGPARIESVSIQTVQTRFKHRLGVTLNRRPDTRVPFFRASLAAPAVDFALT